MSVGACCWFGAFIIKHSLSHSLQDPAEIEAKMAKRRSLTPSERAQAEREDKARRERLKKVKSEDRFGTMRF